MIHFDLDFFMWYKLGGPSSFFYMWISSCPITFVEKTILFPWNSLGTLVKIN